MLPGPRPIHTGQKPTVKINMSATDPSVATESTTWGNGWASELGAAVKVKSWSGSAARLVICSQIRIPAPSRTVWTGRERPDVSSIL